MLLSFSVENFRSFRSEQTLNLLASKRLGGCEPPHCREVPGAGEHVLRVASLYGANGAGKSNLVRALDLLAKLVRFGTPPGKPVAHRPFLLNNETERRPTSFELQFLTKGEVFRYGFCYDGDRIHEEWLDVYEGKKARSLFSRATNELGAVTVNLGAAVAEGASPPQKIRALAEVGARPNQLFLTEIVNLDDPDAQGPRLRCAIQWLSTTLVVTKADIPFNLSPRTIATDKAFATFAGRFLEEASTGISGIEVQTRAVTPSDLLRLPSETAKRFVHGKAEVFPLVLPFPEGGEFVVDFSQENVKDPLTVRGIVTLHNRTDGQRIHFPLRDESDGSQRLLNLLPALYRLTTEGGVFVIDELERSMHPMLARKFIEFFLKAVRGTNSQLIFATHESTLLDLDLVRRDGIWFAEKDNEGATHLYSLADFKVRKDLRIEKGYLEGRFGAIPFLGGIDHLIEEQSAAEPKA